MRALTFAIVVILSLTACISTPGGAPVVGNDPVGMPLVVFDPESNRTFYVEPDHVHVVARQPDGKTIWRVACYPMGMGEIWGDTISELQGPSYNAQFDKRVLVVVIGKGGWALDVGNGEVVFGGFN